jgi:hypothetical protein
MAAMPLLVSLTRRQTILCAVVFLGVQALQLLGDGGGVGLDQTLDVALGGLDHLLAGLELL